MGWMSGVSMLMSDMPWWSRWYLRPAAASMAPRPQRGLAGSGRLVRALWAGRPLVWQIYPQHDNAHHDKLHAFLDWLQAPASLRQFHAAWNAIGDAPLVLPDASTLTEWALCVQSARARLLEQDDLVTHILGFVYEKR